ncbi:MAG: hypothetical protein H7A25_14690 [Leptospiraceae bacterium]|nr:hypothetical protein [Leptospiraceae bacterium]MCP5501148.1 hypothetical protein [Leptospiraceae bacterium]
MKIQVFLTSLFLFLSSCAVKQVTNEDLQCMNLNTKIMCNSNKNCTWSEKRECIRIDQDKGTRTGFENGAGTAGARGNSKNIRHPDDEKEDEHF